MLAHERKKGRIQTLVPHALMNRDSERQPRRLRRGWRANWE